MRRRVVAQARRADHAEVDVAEEEVLLELLRAGEHGAVVPDERRAAVEDQLVLPADEPAVGDRGEVIACPRDEHALAPLALAEVVRRCRQVQDQARPGEGLALERIGRLPDVLADRQPDAVPVDGDRRRAGAVLEVPKLVEHAVVRQVHLAVAGDDIAAVEHGSGVVDVLVALRPAHDRDESLRGLCGEIADRVAAVLQEPLAEQEVLRRVARDRELREDRDASARGGRLAHGCGDPLGVAVDVADGRVDLAERQAQGVDRHGRSVLPRCSRTNAARRGSVARGRASEEVADRALTPVDGAHVLGDERLAGGAGGRCVDRAELRCQRIDRVTVGIAAVLHDDVAGGQAGWADRGGGGCGRRGGQRASVAGGEEDEPAADPGEHERERGQGGEQATHAVIVPALARPLAAHRPATRQPSTPTFNVLGDDCPGLTRHDPQCFREFWPRQHNLVEGCKVAR